MKCVSSSPAAKAGWRQHGEQEVAVGRDAGDAEALERARSRAIASSRVGAVRDHLGEQRIVVDADLGAGLDAAS